MLRPMMQQKPYRRPDGLRISKQQTGRPCRVALFFLCPVAGFGNARPTVTADRLQQTGYSRP